MCVTKNVMVQQTLGWFGAYPEKRKAFRDLAETIDTAAVLNMIRFVHKVHFDVDV